MRIQCSIYYCFAATSAEATTVPKKPTGHYQLLPIMVCWSKVTVNLLTIDRTFWRIMTLLSVSWPAHHCCEEAVEAASDTSDTSFSLFSESFILNRIFKNIGWIFEALLVQSMWITEPRESARHLYYKPDGSRTITTFHDLSDGTLPDRTPESSLWSRCQMRIEIGENFLNAIGLCG